MGIPDYQSPTASADDAVLKPVHAPFRALGTARLGVNLWEWLAYWNQRHYNPTYKPAS